jgi:hypothetical protein
MIVDNRQAILPSGNQVGTDFIPVLTLQSARTLNAGGAIEVSCTSVVGGNSAWARVQITAVQVSSVRLAQLTGN